MTQFADQSNKRPDGVSNIPTIQLPNPGIRKRQYLDLDSPRLSIVNLMAITAICAFTITLITSVGFLGVHGLLIICLIVNVAAAESLRDQPVRFRFWNQFTWGILMPLVCVFGDPFVFGQFELGRVVSISKHGIACYTFIGWQILVLAGSWFVPVNSHRCNAFVAGSLFAGALFAFATAICITPITLIGVMAAGLGIPGLIPWLTGFVFWNTSRLHWQRITNQNGPIWTVTTASFALPVVISVLMYLISLRLDLEYISPDKVPEIPWGF